MPECGYIVTMSSRKKPKAERKDATVRIRVSETEKNVLEQAATKQGLGVSGWLRFLGLQAARRGETRER